MRFLKANTTFTAIIGPVIKSTDGYTPLATLTSSLADINWWLMGANGTNTTMDYQTGNTLGDYTNGYYTLGCLASNTQYPGWLRIEMNGSASGIPTFEDYQVLSAHVFDSLFNTSGTERLQADAWEITGSGISTGTVMMGVNVIQMASAAVSTVTAQLAVNTVLISSVAATAKVIGTGTVYDTMDHGTLMTYLQAFALGDMGATGPSTNVVVYKNYSGSTVMSHTFTTKTRDWSSA